VKDGANMQILIDFKKAKLIENLFSKKEIITFVHSNVMVYELKSFFKFQLKSQCAEIMGQLITLPNVEVVFTDRVDEKTRKHFNVLDKTSLTERVIENLDKILVYIYRKYKTELKDNIDIAIFSDIKDQNIFKVIDKIKDSSSFISIVTNDYNFFQEIKEYAYLKYKITANIKKANEIQNNHIAIVLNTSEQDFGFKSHYVIDVYMKNKILNAKSLNDFFGELPDELSKLSIKKAYLLNKTDELIYLKWKFVELKMQYEFR
jgi:hypothetical protein